MAIDNTTYASQSGALDQMQGDVDQAAADVQSQSASGGPLSAVSEQLRLRNLQSQLDKERKTQLSAAWYPPPSDPLAEQPVKQPGVMERALGALSLPIRGVVGAAEWASGKSDVGLADTINKNVQDPSGDMWGDYLRKIGVQNKWVSTLGGFALDVATDPINWYSAGWRGLIPDVAQGLVKGGPEGAALAGKAWGAKVASKVASPFLSFKDDATALQTLQTNLWKYDKPTFEALEAGKISAEEAIDASWDKLPKFFQAKIQYPGFSETSAKLNEQLDTLLGWDPLTVAHQGILAKMDMKKGVDSILERMPNGETIKKWLVMDNGASLLRNRALADAKTDGEVAKEFISGVADEDWARVVTALRNSDMGTYDPSWVSAAQNARTPDEFFANLATSEPTAKAAWETMQQAAQASFSPEVMQHIRAEMTPEEFNLMLKSGLNDADSIANYAAAKTKTLATMLKTMARKEARAKGMAPYIGSKIYDDAVDALRDRWKVQLGDQVAPIGEMLIGALDFSRKAFVSARLSKIMNPKTYMNEVASVPAILHAQGIKAFAPSRLKLWTESVSMAYGLENKSAGKLMLAMFGDPATAEHFSQYPEEIRSTFGMGPKELQKKVADVFAQTGTNYRTWMKTEGAQFEKLGGIKNFFENVRKSDGKDSSALGAALSAALKRKAGEDPIIYLPEAKRVEDQIRPSFLAQDQLLLGMNDLEDRIKGYAARGGPGSWLAKGAQYVINDARTFDRPDMSGRIFSYGILTKDGLDPQELMLMERQFGGISKADIVGKRVKNGEYHFILSPAKASEITQKLGASYADVPKLVTALRNIPIIGSPFASFPYIMAVKTMTAMKNNPAAINDVQKLFHEISNPKDPLEAVAMQSKYNAWLNGPGKVRLGTFGGNLGNPLYVNMAGGLPWYTLSIFDTSEKSYPSTIFGGLAEAIDRLPVMKTAAGQVAWNNYIAPALIGTEFAQNQFGARLFPEGSTFEERALYALRSLIEGYTPSSVALLPGIIPGIASSISEKATEIIPNYATRSMIRATKGETPLGIPAQESAASRTNRNLGALIGLPTYVVDETNASQNLDNTQ